MALLKATGTQFTLNGSPYPIFGAATYGYYGSNAAFANRVAAAVAAGYNMLRYINFLQTEPYPDLYDPTAGSEFNETIWARIDYGLDQARLAGIKILLDLSDIQGISSARGNSFGTPGMVSMCIDFVEWLAERVNTVNGRLYKNDDTIGIFAIVGEVGQIGEVGSTTNYDTYHAIAGAMKAAGFQQIIHAGGQKPEQNVDASYGHGNYSPGDLLSSPNIDCISVHPYYSQQNMADLHPELLSYSKKRGKPWFVEEFGFSGITPLAKVASFRFVYQNGFKNGSAGHLYWNFDMNGSDGYGYAGFEVSPRTPALYNLTKTYAKTKAYCPRDLIV